MRICELLDKFRDGELTSAERSRFESHLANCDECRMTMSLLDNVVQVIKTEESRPADLADRIARRAFQTKSSWASDVVSWLRPGPVLAALTIALAVFSSLLVISSNQGISAYSEYERVMEELDSTSIASASQAGTDSDLVIWLEQKGNESD